ncbi:hypothetical protein ACHAXS_010347 [Conticribra weissflogii]
MPKRQKEKQYQSAREHRANQSLRSNASTLSSTATRPLPFDCCALTLTPYTTPTCTPDGILFENTAITPFLLKHKSDPVTGRPMTTRDLITLNMDRDESTKRWQCPVLNKPFTDRTKVVAIRQRPERKEANVYSYEAYYELNVKPKNYVDLISGQKFKKEEDVIVLQDPEDESLAKLRDIQNFVHIRDERSKWSANGGGDDSRGIGTSGNVRHSVTASRVMEKLGKEKRKRELAAEEESKKLLNSSGSSNHDKTENDSDKSRDQKSAIETFFAQQPIYTDELLTSLQLTSGKASGSLTSTTLNITRENKARPATKEEIISSQCEALKSLKKKGMVRMFTNLGAMDIEIHCDIVPRTAMNFLLLAEGKEYEGSKFHRSIPNFMIQGGKKPGVGKKKAKFTNGNNSTATNEKENVGDGSYWGAPFADEFDDRLTHTGPGIVSMANSGPGTNARQFFITYKSASHLDRKHSVFGKVVGGMEILKKMERIPTDKLTDRPLEEVMIEEMVILENPVLEALESERERILKKKEEKRLKDRNFKSSALGRGDLGNRDDERGDTEKNAQGNDALKADDGSDFEIGKYLKVEAKSSNSRLKRKARETNEVENDIADPVIRSRLPPPPKQTTFGDFSGW